MRVTTIRCRGLIALLLLVAVLSLAFPVISAEGEGVAEAGVDSSADITIDEAAIESAEPVDAEEDLDYVVEEEEEEDIEELIEEEGDDIKEEEEDIEEEIEEEEPAVNLEEVKAETAAILEKAAAIETEQVADEPEVVEEEEEPVVQEEISAVVDESEKKGKSVIEKIRSMTSQDAKKVAAAGLGIWGAGAGIHWAMQRGG